VSGLAVLCPGQGGQHAEMLDLALATARGAEVVSRAAAALGWDPVARVRAGGPGLFANAVAQPLVCLAEVATWLALRDAVPAPRVLAGYSLGELAAYGCAGALGPEDAVSLATRRAELMDALSPPGAGLVALRGLPLARAAALARAAGAEVAIRNGPDHCVVGGGPGALAEVERRAASAGATAVRIPVCVPAHTSLLSGAVAPFADALARSGLARPPVPVLAGVSGAPVRTREAAIAALSTQLARPIDWASCLAAASELGCTVLLEIGPGSALARMAAEALPAAQVRSAAEFRSLDGVARWVEAALRRR
jgi:[acyl-carrier-protein] S-malonyltransferase